MPVLEFKLIIGAKDETGPAFAAIKAHIASIDKQIATFDKLSNAAKGGRKSKRPYDRVDRPRRPGPQG